MDTDIADELLRNDAEGLLKELDDPQESRRRFDEIIERLEREGLAEPPDEEAKNGPAPTKPA